MLSVHSLGGESIVSSTLASSISMSENVDLKIIGEIIERAPRSAVTFPQVYRAYTQVLETHGLSPSSDTAYYQFLLKLGVIRAPTWGERWDYWRDQTQVEDGTGRLVLRSRVPFLNDASSDLDEGFDDHGDVRLELSADHHDLDYNTIRDDYRKRDEQIEDTGMGNETRVEGEQFSQSLVGHTPSVSAEISELDLPVRTSTPVNKRTSISPPPYLLSDLGRSLDALAITPKGEHQWGRREKSTLGLDLDVDGYVINEDSYDDAYVDDITEVDGGEVDNLEHSRSIVQMERQADTFYNLGLMGRCFSAWSRTTSWLQRTTTQIDNVRSTLLLRQTLLTWRQVLDRHLDLPSTADQHYALSLQRRLLSRWSERVELRRLDRIESKWAEVERERVIKAAWKRWRREVVKRLTKRWEQDLAEREAIAIERRVESTLRSTFDTWRDATLVRAADNLYAQKTTHSIFNTWRETLHRHQLLRGKLAIWESRQTTSTIQGTFETWKTLATVLPLERELVETRELRAIASMWETWKALTTCRRLARDFDERMIKRLAMKKWKRSARKLRMMERDANMIVREKNIRLVQKSFIQWMRAERVKLMVRVHEHRTLKRFMSTWQAKLAAMKALNDVVIKFQKASSIKLLHCSLSRWRDRHGQHQNASLQADLISEGRLVLHCFDTWRQSAERTKKNIVMADKARDFFTLRTAFHCWQIAGVRRKQIAFTEERRIAQLRELFHAWCNATFQNLSDKAKVAAFQRNQGKRILAISLSKWTERVVEVKSREIDVVERRDGLLVRNAMDRWRLAAQRQSDRIGLMNSFIDVQREETLRRLFLYWLDSARTVREHKNRLSQFLQARDNQLLSSTFSIWSDMTRERLLFPIESEVFQRSEDALLFTVFDKWKDRSTRLTAVSYDIRRIRQNIWPKWRRALERAREAKIVAKRDDERLLREVLGWWREKTKVKVGARVRRGRVRPRSSVGSGGDSPVGAKFDRRVVRTSLDSFSGQYSPDPRRVTAPLPSTSRSLIRRPTSSRDLTQHRGTESGSELDKEIGNEVSLNDRLVGGGVKVRGASSVVSEPAYSRLRSELLGGRTGVDNTIALEEEEKSGLRENESSETRLVGALRKGLS